MSNPIYNRTSGGPALAGQAGRTQMQALLMRLHLYIGLFVGPFIFVAALSGLLYALTPQLEERIYADQLFTNSDGPPLPLLRQVEAALAHMGDEAGIAQVRPAPAPGTTTRVIFSAPGAMPPASKAVFIDPVTAEVRGTLMVYGTSGVLPLRTWIDHFHRSLLLGEWGRVYSELAASWLWVSAVSGLALWTMRRRRQPPSARTLAGAGLRNRHASLGLALLVGLLFVSATGLTWSRWAGDNIGVARAALGMSTPVLSTRLGAAATVAPGEHGHHQVTHAPTARTVDITRIDAVLHAARTAGIDAGKIEIRPAATTDRAWTVTEIDRSWPTQVDAVAIDPHSLQVVDKIVFTDFPLAAKLTRWGVDAHMGVLFGLPNQLLLVAAAGGLLTLIAWGYRVWLQRRPRSSAARFDGPLQILQQLPRTAQLAVAGAAAVLAYCLPVLGASLLAFIVLDALLSRRRQPAAA